MEKKEVIFVCISDTHTYHSKMALPKGDVLIHAGDFSYTGSPEEIADFNEFLGEQKDFKHKIVISGNHELTFDLERYSQLKSAYPNHRKKNYEPKDVKSMLTNCTYLEDSSCEVFGYKVYGSPWQPGYPKWAFYADPNTETKEKWAKIPSDTDILITHSPPYEVLDLSDGEVHGGCPDLASEINERVKPLVHVFGHIHEGYGWKKAGERLSINAAICDEHYQVVNRPLVFRLPVKQNEDQKD